jgi:hypothetical protein
MMAQVQVLEVKDDPQNSRRRVVVVRAQGYCQYNKLRGARFEMMEGQVVSASIAESAFPNMIVGEQLDGAHFCRFALGHLRMLVG